MTQHSELTDEIQYLPCADERTRCLAGPRFERQIEHLHRLGARSTAELLIEIAKATGEHAVIADRLQAYAALDADLIRYLGGDRFPPSVLGAVR